MEHIQQNLETYGYAFLFLYSFGGGFIGLVAAGVLSNLGKLDIYYSIYVATISNFLGDIFLFYISKYGRKDIVPYIKKHKRKLALCVIWVKKYGSASIFFQKYIYGVKTFIPIAIGFAKYDSKKFIINNLLASILWGISIGGLAFYASEFMTSMLKSITQRPYIMPIILISIIVSAFFLMSKLTQKKL